MSGVETCSIYGLLGNRAISEVINVSLVLHFLHSADYEVWIIMATERPKAYEKLHVCSFLHMKLSFSFHTVHFTYGKIISDCTAAEGRAEQAADMSKVFFIWIAKMLVNFTYGLTFTLLNALQKSRKKANTPQRDFGASQRFSHMVCSGTTAKGSRPSVVPLGRDAPCSQWEYRQPALLCPYCQAVGMQRRRLRAQVSSKLMVLAHFLQGELAGETSVVAMAAPPIDRAISWSHPSQNLSDAPKMAESWRVLHADWLGNWSEGKYVI